MYACMLMYTALLFSYLSLLRFFFFHIFPFPLFLAVGSEIVSDVLPFAGQSDRTA